MFDYVIIEYSLPNSAPTWVNKAHLWQTKDTPAQYMETYVITKEGRLIHRSVRYEPVPDEERPYWGKPEWETSAIARCCGMITSISTGDVDTSYHGDLRVCATTNTQPYEFYDCVVRFNNGSVQYIKEVKRWKEPEVDPS
jgi:hypothetical protein